MFCIQIIYYTMFKINYNKWTDLEKYTNTLVSDNRKRFLFI